MQLRVTGGSSVHGLLHKGNRGVKYYSNSAVSADRYLVSAQYSQIVHRHLELDETTVVSARR